MQLWDAFLEDYGKEILDWPLRLILEIFYTYNHNGMDAVAEFLRHKRLQLVQPQEKEL